MVMNKLFKKSVLMIALASLVVQVPAAALTIDPQSNEIMFYDENAGIAICQPDGTGPTPGMENLQGIYNYFLEKGTSKKVAAAIVGNIYQESKGDHLVLQPQGSGRTADPSEVGLYADGRKFRNKPGDVSMGKAWGLLQWDPGNAALYWQEEARKDGLAMGDIGELGTQLELTWWHLNNRAPTSQRNVIAHMEAASSPEEAATIMTVRFFGPSDPHNESRRKATAQAMSYPTDPALAAQVSAQTLDHSCTYISGALSEGGLNEEQAIQFAKNYGENRNNSTRDLLTSGNYWRGATNGYNYGANCVSLVVFYLRKFTDTEYQQGDGRMSVTNLANKGGVPTGKEPRVGAIFSWGSRGYGHTGVVLGIHGDQIITAHASFSSGGVGAGDGKTEGKGVAFIRVGKVNETRTWFGQLPSGFAYPENVDMQAISNYLTTGV